MGTKISITGLHKEFLTPAGPFQALRDINLSLEEGEFFCIVGPSGCGKTTLLRILAGLEEASGGEMSIAIRNGSGLAQAMVFQEYSIFPWMTVLDNVAFGLEALGLPRNERREKALEFIRMVGLSRFTSHYPSQLSGGMRQRVAIARALATDPEILLMDEPFAALDAQNRAILQSELVRIWESSRKTVVYITHSIEEALSLGDRIAVMSAQPGTIKKIILVPFSHPRDLVEIRTREDFGRLLAGIWKTLEGEVLRARQETGEI